MNYEYNETDTTIDSRPGAPMAIGAAMGIEIAFQVLTFACSLYSVWPDFDKLQFRDDATQVVLTVGLVTFTVSLVCVLCLRGFQSARVTYVVFFATEIVIAIAETETDSGFYLWLCLHAVFVILLFTPESNDYFDQARQARAEASKVREQRQTGQAINDWFSQPRSEAHYLLKHISPYAKRLIMVNQSDFQFAAGLRPDKQIEMTTTGASQITSDDSPTSLVEEMIEKRDSWTAACLVSLYAFARSGKLFFHMEHSSGLAAVAEIPYRRIRFIKRAWFGDVTWKPASSLIWSSSEIPITHEPLIDHTSTDIPCIPVDQEPR